MVTDLVAPALRSPVSPMLPASLARPLLTGRSAARVGVLSTTNSWVIVPALWTRKVTRPAWAAVADGETANWASVTSTLRASPDVAGVVAGARTAGAAEVLI